ncbi:hypothetical protein V7S43_010262 [Phytophthora oleae]|uniref:Uncharacterized protein n=1 Tax=Phytophthora oleae TaxID=2107226 RepID=A0ABD3FG54_9STRA
MIGCRLGSEDSVSSDQSITFESSFFSSSGLHSGLRTKCRTPSAQSKPRFQDLNTFIKNIGFPPERGDRGRKIGKSQCERLCDTQTAYLAEETGSSTRWDRGACDSPTLSGPSGKPEKSMVDVW